MGLAPLPLYHNFCKWMILLCQSYNNPSRMISLSYTRWIYISKSPHPPLHSNSHILQFEAKETKLDFAWYQGIYFNQHGTSMTKSGQANNHHFSLLALLVNQWKSLIRFRPEYFFLPFTEEDRAYQRSTWSTNLVIIYLS